MEGRAKKRRICENDGTAGGASSTHTSTEGQGMDTSSRYDYEVFLSFRGPDTRAGFTDFLYTSLIDVGIRAFKDDEDLRIGEEFASDLLQAINQSKISIPIFSKGYASSVWCLKEIVQMVECQKTRGQKIMPIFYDVAPSVVRHQTGGYGEAFLSHENKKRYDEETMSKWKAALKVVSFLNGWDLHNKPNRREGDFARKLTQEVFSALKKACLVVSDCLVSVDTHVNSIMERIGARTSETRIIGIHGMGGIGKTTIAKMIYNKLLHDFENCCFLRDIREVTERNGIHSLQNQLISGILKTKCMDIKDIDEGTQTIKERLSNKRVLLLLDDVEKENHINALVCGRDWLGRGSKIIITTRNKSILDVPEVDCSYELSGMDPDQSLQLFSKHAFRKDCPLDEYIEQSMRAIGIAKGLPLALEVIGSLLCCTKKEKWDLTLKKLENVPHVAVQSKLKISYDALDVRQQNIFLDIACLFIGYDKDIVVHFWDESKFPEEAMEVLQNMSLIKIKEDNEIWMHDQLRDLGREMVRQESKMKIEKQSRVWNPKEALDLLRRHEGKTKVEALCLKFDWWQYPFTNKDFMSLSNLKFLRLDSWDFFSLEERLPTNDFQDISDLLPELRWLSWHCIPQAFNIANFSMENIVILELSGRNIMHEWNGWSHMEVMKNLKVLNLTGCHCLERTPNLSALANLERLILRNCSELVEIDGSICRLKHLVSLDAGYCRKLRRLPNELGGLEALNELQIDHCAIDEIPIRQGLKSLRTFTASFCGIITVPLSIGDLASLEYLDLKHCTSLERLPGSIGNLKSLIELDITSTSIKELPTSMGNLKNLKILKMESTPIRKIPDVLWRIEKLEEIELPNGFHSVPVNIDNCIYRNQFLRILRLRYFKIYTVPRLPESLIILELDTLYVDTFPDISNLANLKELDLNFGPCDSDGKSYRPAEEDLMPWWIGKVKRVQSPRLHSHYVTTLPTDASSLISQLKKLDLGCSNLCCLPRLPSSLFLRVCMGKSLWSYPWNLKTLSIIETKYYAILKIRDIGLLGKLQDLELSDLGQLEILPDLSNFNTLISLRVQDCSNLVEIHGELPQSLEELKICFCKSLRKLPDLSLTRLQRVIIGKCGNLVEIRGELPQSLEELLIYYCKSLKKLPNLSRLMGLREVNIGKCGNLVEILDKLPQSLEELVIDSGASLQKLPNLSSLMGLRKVVIRKCGNLVEIQGELPQSLEELLIYCCKSLRKLHDLSSLVRLRKVNIGKCSNLVEIQGELPQSLEELEIDSCESLQKLPYLSSLMGLQEVCVSKCGNLVEIQGELPQSLEELEIFSCESLQKLPYLSSSMGLREVCIDKCDNLVEIQGELPQSLEELEISSCESLQKLPCMSSLMGLREVIIGKCGNLVEIQGELPQSLEKLRIFSCESLLKLPDVSNLKELLYVEIYRCGKLNVEAIYSLCSKKSVEFVGEDDKSEFEGENDEWEGEDGE